MRSIKFKAYVRFLQETHNVLEINLETGSVTTDGYKYAIESDAADLMQFTGLQDKNGVDIYEGDILYHKRQGNCKVEYGNKHFDYAGFTLINKDQMTNTLQNPYIYEVIGNIHQNPELLK
jgi:uncharacterized phage protein (TIGR01671 family)